MLPLVSAALGAALGAAGALGLARRRRECGEDGMAADADGAPPPPAPLRVAAVGPPHPGWAPGAPQPHPFPDSPRITLDPSSTPGSVLYPLVISAVVPRPIALVSSQSAQGEVNLAPYSYFGVLAHDPPTLAVGTCATSGRATRMKDTQQNVLETGELVINIISEWMLEAANHTCGHYDRGVNEFELSGLTPQASTAVRPPRVAESAVQLECVLQHSHDVVNSSGTVTATVLIVRAVAVHVLEAVVDRSPAGAPMVNLERLAPVSRLGGDTYARITEVYDLPRPGKEWQARRAATRVAAA